MSASSPDTLQASGPSGLRLLPASELLEPLARGRVIIVPTDTVYGLALSTAAASPEPLFALKGRDPSKAIPWLVADADELERYDASHSKAACELAARFWPGALTLIVPAAPACPAPFISARGSVALRLPDCAGLRGLIRAHGHPLATSSANRSGEPAAASLKDLDAGLAREAGLALDDPIRPSGRASTIVDCSSDAPRIVRAGDEADAIAAFLSARFPDRLPRA